ncbi:MAG TPA: hypothetical protein VJN22_04865 [Candidatus Eremiobacteraceae bacterium]|nr:hypothetical protein [Candidatus Eremiobacteraceae bacterium]
MTGFEERMLRKQARLSQKLERVKKKLANRALAAQTHRRRDPRDSYLSLMRMMVTTAAFGGFWWLGCDRVNGFIDEIFGERRVTPQRAAVAEPHGQTFWTFGRRRRSGQSQIQPLQQ